MFNLCNSEGKHTKSYPYNFLHYSFTLVCKKYAGMELRIFTFTLIYFVCILFDMPSLCFIVISDNKREISILPDFGQNKKYHSIISIFSQWMDLHYICIKPTSGSKQNISRDNLTQRV